jgi:uncharacterized protein YeaO (DUF488 family)
VVRGHFRNDVIKIKRVYEPPAPEDGLRILVERLWPRGLSKEKAAVDHWMKEVAPSQGLRKWYDHDLQKWEEFRQRYWQELERNPEAVVQLRELLDQGEVTFVYASRDEQHNSTVVLKEFLEQK